MESCRGVSGRAWLERKEPLRESMGCCVPTGARNWENAPSSSRPISELQGGWMSPRAVATGILFSAGRAEPSSFEDVVQPHQVTIPAAVSVKSQHHDDANEDADSLRRKRRNGPRQHPNWVREGGSEGAAAQALVTAAESTLDTVADSLEELWDRESARAASEVERMLQGAIGSVPPRTNTPPPFATAAPTSTPDRVTMMPVALITPPPSTTAAPTSTPDRDCLTGRSPEQYLLDEMLLITDVDLLLDPNTPQGLAFNFILEDETVRRDLCGYPTIAQRYGLATLYYSTTGAGWTQNAGWVSPSRECEWFGIFCADGVRVSNLTLLTNNLVGTIPEEIATLYELNRLQLFANDLFGPIPQGIANLTLLEVLDLEQNDLAGPAFSDSLLSLSNLENLFLSSNSLDGEIPPDIATNMTNLTDLWVADNNLRGTLPETIGNLTTLKTLILYRNGFDGFIPASFSQLTGITNLQLYGNIFGGAFPSELYALTELSVLRVDTNFFTGTISSEIGLLTQLTDLRVNDNFIAGSLPQDLSNLNRLRILTASTNMLNASIPNVFVGFDQLQSVDLSTNFFTGAIPDTIFDSTALESVYLNNNALSGVIPSNYASSPVLDDLFLNDNLLNGTVPTILSGQLPVLNELLLHNNAFTGTVPAAVCALRAAGNLERLFSDCGGAAPEVRCDFPDCCNRCFEAGRAVDDGIVVLRRQRHLARMRQAADARERERRRWREQRQQRQLVVSVAGESSSVLEDDDDDDDSTGSSK